MLHFIFLKSHRLIYGIAFFDGGFPEYILTKNVQLFISLLKRR